MSSLPSVNMGRGNSSKCPDPYEEGDVTNVSSHYFCGNQIQCEYDYIFVISDHLCQRCLECKCNVHFF